MASRVDYAVSCTPIYSHSNAEGASVDVIASDVGKTLGAQGSISVTWGSTVGYSAGAPTYVAATNTTSLGTFTNVKFVYIKHTGFSDTAQTTTTSAYLTVMVGGIVFARLAPGQAIVLPFYIATSPALSATSSSGTTQVEIMATA